MSKSKNIFTWQGKWQGGAEYITLKMAQFLQRQGLSVTLGVYQQNLSSNISQIVFKVPSWIPDSFRSLYASLIFRFKYAHQFQAVYAHTLGWWKYKNNLLFIHDAADLDQYHLYQRTLLHRLTSQLWRKLYLKLCLKPATVLLAASQSFADYAQRHGISPQKIHLTGSFYSKNIFHYVKRPQPKPPYKLIFIGNPTDPRKNFNWLYDQLKDSKNVTVKVLGGSYVGQRHNFVFLGHCSPPKIFQELATTDIFILPSKSEGFSVALLEALATGIPCLVTSAALNPELEDFSNIVLFDTAKDNLVEKINYMVSNYQKLSRYAPKIERYAESSILDQEYRIIQSAL